MKQLKLVPLLLMSIVTILLSALIVKKDSSYFVFCLAATFIAIAIFSLSLTKPRIYWFLGIHWKLEYIAFLQWRGMSEKAAVKYVESIIKARGFYTIKKDVKLLLQNAPDTRLFFQSDLYKATTL